MREVLTIFLIVWVMEVGIVAHARAGEEKSLKSTGQGVAVDTKAQSLKPQTTDLMTGKPIDKKVYKDYNGKRIYFCCVGHRSSFILDPEGYLNKYLLDKSIALEDAPVSK